MSTTGNMSRLNAHLSTQTTHPIIAVDFIGVPFLVDSLMVMSAHNLWSVDLTIDLVL